VFENRVLKKIFGLKEEEEEEGRGGWKKLHSEDLHDLHCLPNFIQAIK
jgi:hypothetical protein